MREKLQVVAGVFGTMKLFEKNIHVQKIKKKDGHQV